MGIFRQPVQLTLLALCGSALLASSALATPAEEITQAVAVNGVDVSVAKPTQFLKAFTAVALRTPPRELLGYVTAAVMLRSDLAPKITAVAINAAVRNLESKPAALHAVIDGIVRAAIAAQPDAALAITKAAVSAAPEWRQCIAAAAIAVLPDLKGAILHAATGRTIPFASLAFSATNSDGSSFIAASLSPANISDLADNSSVNSPEQPPLH